VRATRQVGADRCCVIGHVGCTSERVGADRRGGERRRGKYQRGRQPGIVYLSLSERTTQSGVPGAQAAAGPGSNPMAITHQSSDDLHNVFETICVPSLELPEEIVAPPIVGDESITVPSILAEPIFSFSALPPDAGARTRSEYIALENRDARRSAGSVEMFADDDARPDFEEISGTSANVEDVQLGMGDGSRSSSAVAHCHAANPDGSIVSVYDETILAVPGAEAAKVASHGSANEAGAQERVVSRQDETTRVFEPSIYDTDLETRLASVHLERRGLSVVGVEAAKQGGLHNDQPMSPGFSSQKNGKSGKDVGDRGEDDQVR